MLPYYPQASDKLDAALTIHRLSLSAEWSPFRKREILRSGTVKCGVTYLLSSGEWQPVLA